MASNDLKDYIVTLQCLVVPQENIPRRRISNRLTILTIDISGFLSIGHLKETIYEKKPTAFTNVSADDLDLSLVKISCEELLALSNDPDPYTKILPSKKRELLPVELIAKIFPRDSPPPSEHVHILVEQPICGSSDDFQYEIRPRCENDKIRITTACVYTTPETSVVIDSLLRQEIRHVMHRNIDNFFGSIFPMSQSQALVIDEIMEKCKQEEKWNNEWIGWPKDGSLETQFYQPVLVLVNYVIQQCNRTSGKFARTAVVHANCCPIQNRICAVARKPDIVLVDCSNVQRREGKPVVRWSDIHVVGEIKRTDKNDNVNTDLELAGYVREIFDNQPTRRFVFGFTICGASIRIWLFDRSGGIGSHAFSIHKDPKMFIRVITEFATMGDSRLGYDPSVLIHPFSMGRIDFKKDMHSVSEGQSGTSAESKVERFVLVKKIFHRAVICGCATVCWKAHRLDDDGNELMDKAYIIKDSWRSTLRDYTEGDLLKKATIALKDTVNSRVTKYYYHEDVTIFPISDPAVYQQSQGSKIVDDTFECIRKKLFLSLDDNGRVYSEFHANNPAGNPDCEIHEPLQSCSIGSTSSAVNVNNIPLKKPEYRIHTRLITSTYGKPIYYFNDHLELLVAFRDAIEGHRNLYQIAKILHRDISLYNILIGDDGRGFIIDLDYAIDTGSCQEKNKVQGHRTGTLPFMAIDILLQQSAHGFQHDLESFFYVLCWICCEFEGPCGTPRDKGCERKNLIAWATGLPENIGFMKLGMMQQFDYVMDTFSPYFKSFHRFMRKLHKTMFTAGRIKPDISYEKILKVFQDKIKRRDDENLPTNFGDLRIGT